MLASTIVVATSNQHKISELTALLALHNINVQLLPLSQVAPGLTIEETGSTFEENAYIKAAVVHAATGLPALADDSGLEVEALKGAPGVYSARYSGTDATDASNRALLLQNMQDVDHRAAAFRCVLCYVDDARTIVAEGSCTGSIGHRESGTNGFGYDALFTADGDSETFAALAAEVKHDRSHRGAAVAAFARRLREDVANADQPLFRDAVLRGCIAASIGDSTMLASALSRITSTAESKYMYEALLQCYLFAGFPAALDALTQWHGHASQHGLLPQAAPAEPPSFQQYADDGTKLCKDIYGTVFPRMMERLEQISPDLASWMIIEGYGKTLSRPGLSVIDRELCNVAVLAALLRTTQLHSHVRGALRVGASEQDVMDVAHAVTECCGGRHGDAIRTILAGLTA
jgi:XTP/dITP diphosphohydrolase